MIDHCSVTDASGWRNVYQRRCRPGDHVFTCDPNGENPRNIAACEFDWETAVDEDWQRVLGTCARGVYRKVEPVCSSRATFICTEGA